MLAIRAASTYRHPKAMALGMAIGLSLGLMPKDNLFALLLCVSLFWIRANILLAAATMCMVAMFATWLDPYMEPVGIYLLESELLHPVWNMVSTLPLVAWFRWNNTIVLSSIIVGGISFLPTYILCFIASTRIVSFHSRLLQEKSPTTNQEAKESSVTAVEQRKRQIVDSETLLDVRRKAFQVAEDSVSRIDGSDELSSRPKLFTAPPSASPALAFSSSIDSTASARKTEAIKRHSNLLDNILPQADSSVVAKDGDHIPSDPYVNNIAQVRETIIEIVRYRPGSQTPSSLVCPVHRKRFTNIALPILGQLFLLWHPIQTQFNFFPQPQSLLSRIPLMYLQCHSQSSQSTLKHPRK